MTGTSATSGSGALSALLHEQRSFAPTADQQARANAQPGIYKEAAADPLAWWAEQAERLTWDYHWETCSTGTSPTPSGSSAVGSTPHTTASTATSRPVWGTGWRTTGWASPRATPAPSPTPTSSAWCARRPTPCVELGVKAGDRVAIYLPMIPEAVVAMLACARLGAPHSVVFGGFSAEALASRIVDADARVVITADGGFRRGSASPLKPHVDQALEQCPDVRPWWWSGAPGRTSTGPRGATSGGTSWSTARPTPTRRNPSTPSSPLYIMYTSGTTAKPKGILHTTGGYLVHTCHHPPPGLRHQARDDVFWTAADIGWVTGHSYIVYGPLANATTSVIYEGTPDAGGKDRWWRIVEDYKVSILYTAPTTIRTLMKWGHEYPAAHDLSSLRLLGSVGEPINPEAWMWYRRHVGGDRCPIVDTWWQTETGGILITPLPGITATKPGAAMAPFPGIGVDVVDNDGRSVGNGQGGYLVLTDPWPGMLRGIWGDPQRYAETYWSRFSGRYFAGDGAKKDEDGDLWLLGRVDDVMNISGHRISTTEIEHALVGHPSVAEAAVVGASDPTTGQAIVAFVTVKAERDRGPAGRDAGGRAARDGGHHHRPDRQAAPDPPHPGAAQDP